MTLKPVDPNTLSVIMLLERALKAARRGEIQSVAVATVETGAIAGGAFVAGPNIALLHYSIASLQHRILTYTGDEPLDLDEVEQ